ncbi:acetyl esterase [Actimicrobium sp. GrIS 1.19]|uniref:alpha/beta hydrolase n=1 Tax=Actimicrobium sp. GrIS 1.19 TaxID=3071708 RepID=UPI002E06F40E|nr:acetyl esterase [Actimicrobium sp. GrIS 1.19]
MRSLVARGGQGELAVRLYESPGPSAGLLVFFPPGGFVQDLLDDIDPFVRALALRTNLKVLATSYTLAREAPFPAAAEDAHAVLNWSVKNRVLLGWDGRQLVVAGIEAGGNLAAVASLMANDRDEPEIAAQILITPMLDPGLSTCSMRAMVAGDDGAVVADACALYYRSYIKHASDRIHPYASPLQSTRLKGLPRTLILSAEDDALRDEADGYCEKLVSNGVAAQVIRMPAMHLQNPTDRCDGMRIDIALNAISTFLKALP